MKSATLLLVAIISLFARPVFSANNEVSDFQLSAFSEQLNSLQSQLIGILKELSPSEELKAFQDSTAKWEEYRKAQSHFEASLNAPKPEEYKSRYSETFARITKDRIAFLEPLLEPIKYQKKTEQGAAANP